MTTPTTPYDARIDDRSIFPYVRAKLRMKRDGYLQALADMQPRIDALVAAAEEALEELEVLLQAVELRDEKGRRAPDVRDHLRAALKLEEKE